jgi:hypothetical protein
VSVHRIRAYDPLAARTIWGYLVYDLDHPSQSPVFVECSSKDAALRVLEHNIVPEARKLAKRELGPVQIMED